MSPEAYKASRVSLGFSVGAWCDELGISVDTHKSYQSARLEIPSKVSNHIRRLQQLAAAGVSLK